jgi:hypothetical protein
MMYSAWARLANTRMHTRTLTHTQAKRTTQKISENFCRSRSMLGSVSGSGYHRVKQSSRIRSESMHDRGHFTPQNKPYAPVGEIEDDMTLMEQVKDEFPHLMHKKPITDKERWLACKKLVMNDLEGHQVVLDSYDEELFKVSYVYACMYACMYVRMYVCCMYVCVCTCVYMCRVCEYIYIYIYIYIFGIHAIHIHTHTHPM